jgi:hypothetical protein
MTSLQKELEILGSKLQSLMESLQSILTSNPSYPELLSQFNTVAAQFSMLTFELDQIILFAHILPKEDPDFFPRVLLRTKLDPAVQDLFDIDIPPQDKIREEINTWELMVDQTNQYRMTCLEIITELRQEIESFLKPIPKQIQPEQSDPLLPVLSYISSGIEL